MAREGRARIGRVGTLTPNLDDGDLFPGGLGPGAGQQLSDRAGPRPKAGLSRTPR